jgi:thiol-disulfide isomerase/thioredoxin
VTSQSPNNAIPTDDYKNAWSSIQNLVVNEGASWSGREPNRVFLNCGENRFADISSLSTADYKGDGRAVATLDWDGDGRLDIVLKSRTAPRVRLLRNLADSSANALTVKLVGTESNRDAIGATVFLEVGGRKLRQTVRAGEGYLAQSSKRLHFGLAQSTEVGLLKVRWPSGKTQQWLGVSAGQFIKIVEGEEALQVIPRPSQLAFTQANPVDIQPDGKMPVRIPLIERIPMAPVLLPAFDNPSRRVADLAGSPVLINLWGMTCATCLKELASFQRNKKKLEKVGLKIITLNTDAEDQRGKVIEMISKFGFSDGAGYTDASFMSVLEIFLGEVIGQYKGTPLPTSLLLDPNGNLVAIYQGKVPMKMLLRDAGMAKTLDPRLTSLSQFSFGLRLIQRQRDFAGMAQLFAGIGNKALEMYYRNLVPPSSGH